MKSTKFQTNGNFQKLALITNKEVLSFRDALIYLDVSESFLYKMTSNRIISFTKPNNGKLYFKKSDLDKWMLSNEYKSKSEIENEVLIKIRQNGKSK